MQVGGTVRRGHRGLPALHVGRQREDLRHPSRGDESAGEVVRALDEERHRGQESGDVTVDGHQVADRDGAVGRHPCGDPGDEGQEEDRQAGAQGLHPAGERGDAVPVGEQGLGPFAVAAGEHRLPSDAVQHVQAGDDVHRLGGEVPLLLPVGPFGAVQPLHQRADGHGQQGDAEQYHERQRCGDAEQQHGGRGVGDHRAHTRPGDGQGLCDPARVPCLQMRQFTSGHLARQSRAEPGDLPDDDLHRAVRGVDPDQGHRAVAQDAEDGDERADREEGRHPQDQLPPVSRPEAAVDRLCHEVRRQHQRAHPGAAPQGSQKDPAALPRHQPPQETRRAAVIRFPGIGVGDPVRVRTRVRPFAHLAPSGVRGAGVPRPPAVGRAPRCLRVEIIGVMLFARRGLVKAAWRRGRTHRADPAR